MKNIICLQVLLSVVLFVANSTVIAQDNGLDQVEVTKFLWEKTKLTPRSGAPSRCGGRCRGMCSSQPNCVWSNVLENVRVTDFFDGKFGKESQIYRFDGPTKNVVRSNCYVDTTVPSEKRTATIEVLDKVEFQKTTELKRTKEQSISVDVTGTLGFVEAKVGGEIKNTLETTVGTSTTETYENNRSLETEIIWQEIPARTAFWIEMYTSRATIKVPYSGQAIVDADHIQQWRRIQRDGSLGAIWGNNTRNLGPLSKTILPDSATREVNVSMLVVPEGGSSTIFKKYYERDLNDEDCDDDWPGVVESSFEDSFSQADLFTLVSEELPPSDGNKSGTSPAPRCKVREVSSNQRGNTLNAEFSLDVGRCADRSSGEISFISVAVNNEDGELVSEPGFTIWNSESEEKFNVNFRNSSQFDADESFIELDNIDAECYCN